MAQAALSEILFVSDLDGTLLTPQAVIGEDTADILNRLMAQGLRFTVATARSWRSAAPLLTPLHLTLPAVMHNGAHIMDPVTGAFLEKCLLNPEQRRRIVGAFLASDACPLVYGLVDGQQRISYLTRYAASPSVRHYSGAGQADPRLRPVESVEELLMGEVHYVSSLHSKSALEPLAPIFHAMRDLGVIFMEDTYIKGLYWLEIMREDASKAEGVRKLKRITGAKYLVCFGDNVNDLPMFAAADASFAVANATPALKQAATRVIASNGEEGVARFLERVMDALPPTLA